VFLLTILTAYNLIRLEKTGRWTALHRRTVWSWSESTSTTCPVS